jgi:hypothetical protein
VLSIIIRSKPAVAAIYRAMPCTTAQASIASGLRMDATRDALKLLVAAKLIYCTHYTPLHEPVFDKGNKPNAVRPTPELVRTAYEQQPARQEYRRNYGKQYREANKERIKARTKAARKETYAARDARKRALKILATVPADSPKTTWINLS